MLSLEGLDNSDMSVSIGEPSKQGTSMTSRYIAYRLTTKPKGYVVQRRFSDFIWLREGSISPSSSLSLSF